MPISEAIRDVEQNSPACKAKSTPLNYAGRRKLWCLIKRHQISNNEKYNISEFKPGLYQVVVKGCDRLFVTIT